MLETPQRRERLCTSWGLCKPSPPRCMAQNFLPVSYAGAVAGHPLRPRRRHTTWATTTSACLCACYRVSYALALPVPACYCLWCLCLLVVLALLIVSVHLTLLNKVWIELNWIELNWILWFEICRVKIDIVRFWSSFSSESQADWRHSWRISPGRIFKACPDIFFSSRNYGF